MTAAKTQGRETVSPFAWSELRRDLFPIALFGAATLFIAFAETGEAYDRHWTTAWLLTGLATVGLAGAKLIRLTHPMLWSAGMMVLLIQGFRGGCERWEVLALWGWLWTWMWTLPVDRGRFWQGAKALPLVALLIGGLMLLHAVQQMWNGQWDHGASYAMSLPWAHRNIALEALFAMCVLGGHISKERWLRWWGFITLLALVYQVRSVLLASALWMLFSLWTSGMATRRVKQAFLGATLLFALVQVAWNLLPQEERVERFRTLPDIVKSLDVRYNLGAAESSSIRLKLWDWTLDHAQPLGAGLASWRDDAEGWVNVANNRCGEGIRRAHSELLQWSYELGWIPLLLLIGLCWPLRQSLGRWAWFILPFIAFTFPAERAEILWPFAILGWWLKSRFPPDDSPRVAPRALLIGAASALLLLIGSWVTAQNAIGRVLRQSGTFKVDWSSTEELCIGLHPKDVALNHSEIIRAMSAYNQRRPNQGKAILDAHLDAHPRCLSGLRVQRKAAGLPTDPASMCTAVDAVLEGTQ